jgi:hypothetical protein
MERTQASQGNAQAAPQGVQECAMRRAESSMVNVMYSELYPVSRSLRDIFTVVTLVLVIAIALAP